MFVSKRLLAASLAWLFLVSFGVAASLTGVVRDAEANRPMANATVAIESIERTVFTDRSGAYNFANIAPGTYDVTVRYLGYADASQSVTVGDLGATRADFEIGYGDVIKLENFVVEGIREGQARALQQKRNADNIIDGSDDSRQSASAGNGR